MIKYEVSYLFDDILRKIFDYDLYDNEKVLKIISKFCSFEQKKVLNNFTNHYEKSRDILKSLMKNESFLSILKKEQIIDVHQEEIW